MNSKQDYRILLVEDEHDIAELISTQLERQGHKVTHIDNGSKALEFIQEERNECHKNYDLFVLDRMLPGVDGIEICKFIRMYNKTKQHPILLLTAMGEAEHVVQGLNAGADDYVAKPFHSNVLNARIESLIRRSQFNNSSENIGNHPDIFEHLEIKIDQKQCCAWFRDEVLQLTKSEYRLLLNFMKDPGKVFTREQLVDLIQDGPIHVTNRTIDTHIFGLRKKLNNSSDLIETVRGIGYRIKV
jgi:DNA-binding response OmpR family regulator